MREVKDQGGFGGEGLIMRPNGLAFSCRERAGQCLQNATDLARKAVNCNAGLGRDWIVAAMNEMFG